jgi:putative endopeptidase
MNSLFAAVALTITACSASPRTSAPPERAVTLAAVGLEPASLDRSVDPCVDFFQFACGGWLKSQQIPADRASWSRWAQIDEHNKAALHTLLEAAASSSDPTSKQLGDYYASCMDVAAIDKSGLAPIRSLLTTTTNVRDDASWFAALVSLHAIGVQVVFGAGAYADAKGSTTNVLHLEAAGLELPDRDYYLTPAFRTKLDAFHTHVAKMLALAGMTPTAASTGAADVIKIETEIATHTKTAVERHDQAAAYNPTDAAGLSAQVKTIHWAAYWKALGVTPSPKLVIGSPAYFAHIDALRARFKPTQWANYFTYHLVSGMAFSLGSAMDDEDFNLQKALTGVTERPERFKRCIDDTSSALGELLGQKYVAANFTGGSRQRATEIFDSVAHAVGKNIDRAEWMSTTTRARAQRKLSALVRMVGYPDQWRAYDFAVARNDFAGNKLRAAAFEVHRLLSRAGTPVDRSEWTMNAFTVNAYYNAKANHIAVPAGLLQPPLFRADRSLAVNVGGIGWVLGHELTHAFDDQGSLYDDVGNLESWWQPHDRANFEARGACVVDQYAAYEVLPGQFVNGQLTLSENIADLGGVKAAFQAYRALRSGAVIRDVADGFTEDQQFFLAIAQGDCTKNRPEEIQRLLTTDQHAPADLVLKGPLRNLPEFAEAFHCPVGAPMHPPKTCTVW